MNPVAIIHGIIAFLVMGASWPLVKRKIKPNRWYGVRIPEAFKSQERWLEINEYGGRLLLWWGLAIAIMAGTGLTLPPKYWTDYACGAPVIFLGGLAIVTVLIFR